MPGGSKGDGGPKKKYDPYKAKKNKESEAESGASLGGYAPDVVAEVEQETNTETGVILERWDPVLAAILGGEL